MHGPIVQELLQRVNSHSLWLWQGKIMYFLVRLLAFFERTRLNLKQVLTGITYEKVSQFDCFHKQHCNLILYIAQFPPPSLFTNVSPLDLDTYVGSCT